jgi:hypothetical protein
MDITYHGIQVSMSPNAFLVVLDVHRLSAMRADVGLASEFKEEVCDLASVRLTDTGPYEGPQCQFDPQYELERLFRR